MKETITEQLSIIDKLLRDSKTREALHILDKIDSSALSKADYAYCCILITEANLDFGNYDIHKQIDTALNFYKYSQDNENFARAKYLQGRLLLSQGKTFEAKEVLLESYVNYKRSENPNGLKRVLGRLAQVFYIEGEIDNAIRHLNSGIDICKKLGDNNGVTAFSANVANIFFRTGALHKAITQLESNREKIMQLGDEYRYRFLLMYSIITAFLGDIKSALEIIFQTNELPAEFKREKAEYYEYLGWIYILDGSFEKAEKTLLAGLELSLKIAPESALIAQTKRLLADTYIGLNKFDLAQKYAEEALIVAEKINERVEIAGCYRVFAQIAAHNGEKQKAKDWFKKALNLFSMISFQYELASTRFLAAKSGWYEDGERAALLFLAKEYFQAEDIKHYVERINSELSLSPHQRVAIKRSDEKAPVFIAAHLDTLRIRNLAENVAPSDMTILLTGPTGAGKDQLAKYIHYYSGREGLFIQVNCAAIPDGMVESELFGCRKGAFTGALSDRQGLFETADKGTFYLNEIADSPPALQAKLLEVIETKVVRRLGGNESKKIDIRLIASTNHNLEEDTREGGFRLDLYHRLNEIPIFIPPLSKRLEDIPILARYFLIQCGLDLEKNGNSRSFNELSHLLMTYDWPGNVRELHSELNRLFYITKGDIPAMLEILRESNREGSKYQQIIWAMSKAEGNKSRAARILGIGESTLRYRLNKYKLDQSN